MSTYRMDDGTVVKTENATKSWEEDTEWDGNNHISVNTRSQWSHEILYRSRKGRYWIEYTSNYQGQLGSAEWISKQRATAWLLLNSKELPGELEQFREQVEE